VEGNETILTGSVVDQSPLHGILAKINDLGLSLVSVNKLPDNEGVNEKVSLVFRSRLLDYYIEMPV